MTITVLSFWASTDQNSVTYTANLHDYLETLPKIKRFYQPD